jgi:hypothetical protein
MNRDPYLVSTELLAFNPESECLVIAGSDFAAMTDALKYAIETYEQAPRFMLIQAEDTGAVPFDERVDLQLLRMLLEQRPTWCAWIEVHTLDLFSTRIAEIAVICDWLEAASVEFVLMQRLQSSYSPKDLRVSASRVLEQERALPGLKERW